MIWKKICLLLLIVVTAQAGVFDGRYPSARATAMSEAFVAVANDVWAAYYNPAGLAELNSYQFGSAVQRPFNQSFMSNSFFAAALPLPGSFGSAALTMEFYGLKYQGRSMISETTTTLSHGFYLLKDIQSTLALGYNLRWYHLSLGESVEGRELGSSGTLGVDVGLQAALFYRTYLGVYAYNLNAPKLGSQLKHELPQRLVIGAAYRPVTGLMTTLNFDKTVGFDTFLEGGFEFEPAPWLALRVGASTSPNRFSAGFGINYHGIHLDYSFRNHPVLPETHKIGLMYQFGNK